MGNPERNRTNQVIRLAHAKKAPFCWRKIIAAILEGVETEPARELLAKTNLTGRVVFTRRFGALDLSSVTRDYAKENLFWLNERTLPPAQVGVYGDEPVYKISAEDPRVKLARLFLLELSNSIMRTLLTQ